MSDKNRNSMKNSQHTPTCFLFDFGNVVGFFDRMITYDRIVAISGGAVDQSQVEDAVHEGNLFSRYEKGEVSSEEFIGSILGRLSITAPFEAVKQAWSDILTPNMDVIELFPRLKEASFKLVMGSNNNPMHYEQIRKQFGFWLKQFDSIIVSHEVGVMKPDRKFFIRCIEECGCKPESIVYIDDLEENIHAAKRMGFIVVHYHSGVKLEIELSRLGLLLER